MKILFGIQATGNGHLSRSIELYQLLKANPIVTQLDVIISGNNSNLDVPFDITYQYKGFSFSYGKNGNISVFKSFLKANFLSFWYGVFRTPIRQYDLIISDYEPISVWGAKLRGIHTIGLGNIFSLSSKNFPKMENSNRITKLFTKVFCPVDQKVAMHYQKFDDFIFYPMIRKEIRESISVDKNFVLVYLLSFTEEQLINFFGNDYLKPTHFVIYTKCTQEKKIASNITIKPIGKSFTEDMVSCSGVITAGGFQTTAEALYLGKKLLCIPIKKQVEQQSNARILEDIGIKVLKGLDLYEIKKWILHSKAVQIKFEDDMPAMVNRILDAA
jgi:uncharacterized protein (TIGR00661 family)